MSEILQDLEGAVEAAREDLRALRITGDDDVAEVKSVLARLEAVEAQVAGMRLQLIGEAQLAGAYGAVDQVRSSPRATTGRASGTLRLARELSDRFWVLSDALGEGRISEAQAEAIVTGLNRLPIALGRTDLERCQRQLLTYCDELGPRELRVAATRMWELLDPDGAEACEANRLAREERHAKVRRSFRLTPDHHGSMRLSGQLPVADAALLQAQLDALMPSAASYVGDGETLAPEPDARRADALLLLAAIAARAGDLPERAGDRPHVHVTMPLSMLTAGTGRAELVGTHGETVSAREARRLACDAGLIPIVLGTRSQPLDVGSEHRLVTKPIRAALVERDQGCAFPHCDARPTACEAHHIQPWWAGGETSLANLVLLCPYHHRVVEPDPNQRPAWQWHIHLDDTTGRPVFTPPTSVDPSRTPRQHRRFTLADLTAPPPAEDPAERVRASWPPLPEPEDDPWHPRPERSEGRAPASVP